MGFKKKKKKKGKIVKVLVLTVEYVPPKKRLLSLLLTNSFKRKRKATKADVTRILGNLRHAAKLKCKISLFYSKLRVLRRLRRELPGRAVEDQVQPALRPLE